LNAFAAVVLAALVLPVHAARADMSWETRTVVTLKAGGAEQEMENTRNSYALKANVLRIDDPAAGGARFLNFQTRNGLFLSFRDKVFITMSLTDMIAASQDALQEIWNDLPQRELMLQNMTGHERDIMAAQIEAEKIKQALWRNNYKVRPAQGKAEVNGHQCQEYEGMSGDSVFQEIWVAQDISLDPLYRSYFAPNMNQLDPTQYGYFSAVPGFPMKVVTHYGAVTITQEVTHFDNSPIPVDAFTIPPGFKESPLVNRQPDQ
jgi:hypothetical protein